MSLRRPLASIIAVASLLGGAAVERPARAEEPEPYSDVERTFWSLVPRSQPAIPRFEAAADRAWVRNPIDAFVLQALRERGLSPASEADRRTLARRLSFDLTGLPPSPEEVARFETDPSPTAFDQYVDRLLASPHYGERWAQHWLDVVRYAETEGFEYDAHRPGAWRYRDYVIRAFDADKPFDRFVAEQIAGDELAADEPPGPRRDELLVAAGFHRLGPVRRNAGNPDVAFSRNEVLTEMTNAVGSTFLGLTVGCARCHDHMFDPIRQHDYYRLQTFFAATHETDVPLADAEERRRWQAQTDEIKAELKRVKERLEDASGEEEPALRKRIAELDASLPAPLDAISTVMHDPSKTTPIHRLKRGEESQPLERMGHRVPGVFLPAAAPELPADLPRPKTAVAEWLTARDHPLVARVLANRVWQFHFGRGLVDTANDFGANGGEPTHPELLDWLANELVAGGWKLKPLHRLIVSSSAYRQSSRIDAARERPGRATDPDLRLLWRFPRRRLSAEEVRDALHETAGRLDRRAGGPSVIVPVEAELTQLLYKPSQWAVAPNPADHRRRAIYLIAKRNLREPFLETFDQPDLQTSCSRRATTTHAPQALELLNGRLSNDLAEAFAERLRRDGGDDVAAQIERGFRLAIGRPPTDDERRLSTAFLAANPPREFALALFNLNAFLYVD